MIPQGPFRLDRGATVSIQTQLSGETAEIALEFEHLDQPCVLHWGVGRGSRHWQVPAPADWPIGSRPAGGTAVATPIPATPSRVAVLVRPAAGDTSLDFVLFFPASGRWDNNHGRDYHVPLSAGDAAPSRPATAELESLASLIIERESGPHSWTLMHRFDLCHDLLGRVGRNDTAGLALLFIWLRFSAIRQLDWQRNFNTKPRELAHAQDRLTLEIAGRYARERDERPWLRLMLSTVGRGGEGQRVRDEVLEIMHRHHIKEVSGHFMEEWHQKLHNNTTPDDVVICRAFLAFLRSNGNRAAFYSTLDEAGVTRARLQGYERPIRSDPDFVPYLKDALIHDFEEFLRVLNRLHSGSDLDAAADGVSGLLDGDLRGSVDWIQRHRAEDAAPLDTLVARITGARNLVGARLDAVRDAGEARAFLYLDLALEDLVRLAIERHVHRRLPIDAMVRLIALALEHVRLSLDDEELERCRRQWERVRTGPAGDLLWTLRAEAALERMGRAVADVTDRWRQVLQPLSEHIGHGVHADAWTIAAFGEEVIRGRPIVVLPVLARLLRQSVREQGGLPPWQVISPGRGAGTLHVIDSLASIQGTRFAHPSVVLAAKVGGQEEIPEGITAVVTPEDVDVLSHVAIRARHAGTLLASCYDAGQIDRLRSLAGQPITLALASSGDVVVQAGQAEEPAGRRAARAIHLVAPGAFAGYAVWRDRFDEHTVGRKALGLAHLEGRVPSWIRLPRSAAVPFGAMEHALSDPVNAGVKRHHAETRWRLGQIARDDAGGRRLALDELRRAVAALAAPEGALEALRSAMAAAGLAWPEADLAWRRVAQVWASKWNERAFLNREANLIDHDALVMAVLIQPVVEADWAFVIHTTSPLTGARDELYAEAVRGLGETLVGNHPGRPLSFTWHKATGEARLRTLPSKSAGLFGGRQIFRSDSNAEDLAGYAGAGLYDSVMLDAPREVPLDDTDDPLARDDELRRDLMTGIAQVGLAVEHACDTAQDIEGAWAGGAWWVLQSRPQVEAGRG